MKFKDKHRFVRSNMKRNKTRVWMTILASTIGCAFLIMLASIGFAFQKSAVDEMMKNRLVNEIEVHKEDTLKIEDIKKLEKIKDVKAVTRKKYSPAGDFSLGEYKIGTEVISAYMPAEVKANFELEKGRMPKEKNEIVVGYDFAKQLRKEMPDDAFDGLSEEEAQKKQDEYAYNQDILGKTLSYDWTNVVNAENGKETKKSVEVKVVGIGKKPTKAWANSSQAYITEDLYQEVKDFMGEKNSDGYQDVKVYTSSAEDVKKVTEQIEKQGFETYSVIKELKKMNVFFTLFKAGLIFIGAIAVLIASIGIFNTMTMAVTERSQDIGIMKAIGATPKTIKRIFLLESGYIGLWGVGLGTLLAYIVSYLVNLALPIITQQFAGEKPPEGFMISYIPWSLTVIAIIICMGVTLISGWRPASKATTVDVLKALRRDV